MSENALEPERAARDYPRRRILLRLFIWEALVLFLAVYSILSGGLYSTSVAILAMVSPLAVGAVVWLASAGALSRLAARQRRWSLVKFMIWIVLFTAVDAYFVICVRPAFRASIEIARRVVIRAAAGRIAAACIDAANAKGGRYPKSLDDLVRSGRITPSDLSPLPLRKPFTSPPLPGTPTQFLYFGDGLTTASKSDVAILASGDVLHSGFRLLVRPDGKCVWISSQQFSTVESSVRAHQPLAVLKTARTFPDNFRGLKQEPSLLSQN